MPHRRRDSRPADLETVAAQRVGLMQFVQTGQPFVKPRSGSRRVRKADSRS